MKILQNPALRSVDDGQGATDTSMIQATWRELLPPRGATTLQLAGAGTDGEGAGRPRKYKKSVRNKWEDLRGAAKGRAGGGSPSIARSPKP